MPDVEFDSLLERMPAIAEAVNAFSSEGVQREAFQVLVGAFTGQLHVSTKGHSALKDDLPTSTARASSDGRAPSPATGKKPARRKGERYTPRVMKDLELAPSGKMSFVDFIAQKQPKSNEDRYAVSVYYLEQVAEVRPITFDHISSVFRFTAGWREPSNVPSGITTTASRKGHIDTSDYNDLKTTARGRNFVEHELPHKAKR